jgi:hypothetical protein
MATQRMTSAWADAGGHTTAHLLTTAAGAAAVQTAIAAKSNAAVLLSWEGTLVVNPTPSPVNASFPDVFDQAALLFQTPAGSITTIVIPAPMANIFLADGETVDPAQISAIITAVIANTVTQNGTPVTSYVSGYRRRAG